MRWNLVSLKNNSMLVLKACFMKRDIEGLVQSRSSMYLRTVHELSAGVRSKIEDQRVLGGDHKSLQDGFGRRACFGESNDFVELSGEVAPWAHLREGKQLASLQGVRTKKLERRRCDFLSRNELLQTQKATGCFIRPRPSMATFSTAQGQL